MDSTNYSSGNEQSAEQPSRPYNGLYRAGVVLALATVIAVEGCVPKSILGYHLEKDHAKRKAVPCQTRIPSKHLGTTIAKAHAEAIAGVTVTVDSGGSITGPVRIKAISGAGAGSSLRNEHEHGKPGCGLTDKYGNPQ